MTQERPQDGREHTVIGPAKTDLNSGKTGVNVEVVSGNVRVEFPDVSFVLTEGNILDIVGGQEGHIASQAEQAKVIITNKERNK